MPCFVHEPSQHGVEIGLFLGTDTVAAELAIRDGLHVQTLDDRLYRQFVRQVRLVGKDEEGYTGNPWSDEQCLELFSGNRKCSLVSCIDDEAPQLAWRRPGYIRPTLWHLPHDNSAPNFPGNVVGRRHPSYTSVGWQLEPMHTISRSHVLVEPVSYCIQW